ncbi:MAG: class I SAM-dependent methyltransferase [Bacteroidia bacterium]|nr:class I SAM-dependent methyltransferase [Bacteroidia bacterium]
METEGWKILTTKKIEDFVEKNLSENPAELALRLPNNEFPVALVSARIKYLQKAKAKLPTFYASRCFFTPKAYEQCSSEAAVLLKSRNGHSALDLSCGLGVDTWNWARQFEHVTSLEPDTELSSIVQENLGRLGLANVKLHSIRAEDFLAAYDGPAFDLIYADPDRRDEHNRRLHDPREGSPNLLELWPLLRKHGRSLMIKLSPMVDVQEATRMFPEASSIIVLSVDGECKEVLVEIVWESPIAEPRRELWISRQGEVMKLALPGRPATTEAALPDPHAIRALAEPDVAAYKANDLQGFLNAGDWRSDWQCNHRQGFYWSAQNPTKPFPGRILRVEQAFPFKPKAIAKFLKSKGIARVDITRRHFPQSVVEIRKALQLKDGGPYQLWCTEIGKEKWAFLGK